MATIQRIGALWKLRWLLKNPAGVVGVLRDPQTPLIARILPIAALLYVLFPIDILPDFFPLLGQIDDISIAVGLIYYALRQVPVSVLKTHGVVFDDSANDQRA